MVDDPAGASQVWANSDLDTALTENTTTDSDNNTVIDLNGAACDLLTESLGSLRLTAIDFKDLEQEFRLSQKIKNTEAIITQYEAKRLPRQSTATRSDVGYPGYYGPLYNLGDDI